MALDTSVRLEIPSEIRLVDLVHVASEKMAEMAGLEADDALNVALAVREAVINAMLHGNNEDPNLRVGLTITAGPDAFTATVTDQGTGFNPNETPDPTEEDNLLNASGRGLLLIRAFVDEVEFKNSTNGGMAIIMTKKIPTEDSRR